MPRVICDRPNASNHINGVNFFPLEDGGMVSEEISQEQLEHFLLIPGYTDYDADEREVEEPKTPEAPPTRRRAAKAAPKAKDDKKPAPAPEPAPAAAPAPEAPVEPTAPEAEKVEEPAPEQPAPTDKPATEEAPQDGADGQQQEESTNEAGAAADSESEPPLF